jgi:hypothetical protein
MAGKKKERDNHHRRTTFAVAPDVGMNISKRVTTGDACCLRFASATKVNLGIVTDNHNTQLN